MPEDASDLIDWQFSKSVFGADLAGTVARHPMRNCPLVLPMPRSAAHMQLAGKELTISSPIPTVTTR